MIAAYLYWSVIAGGTEDISWRSVTFNGSSVTGTLIASGDEPCYSGGANTSYNYRAVVTSLVTGDGTYTIGGFEQGGAWPTIPQSEGATLVVVYNDSALFEPTDSKTILIYDGIDTIDNAVSRISELVIP